MRHVLVGLGLAGILLAGCERYRPMPLDAESVEKALTPAEAEVLQVGAETLNHPILRPLALDLKDGLSPDEAAVIAVLNSPDLRAARDERAVAEAEVLQAGILPNPVRTFNYDFVSFGSTAGEFNPWAFGLEWEVTALISRKAKVRAAKAHRKAVDLDIAWKEWQTAEAAKTVVYKLYGLQAQVALAEENERRLSENLALVRKAVAAGQMTGVDEAAAQAALDQALAKKLGLQEQGHLQRLALNRIVGMPATTEFVLEKGFELPAHLDPPTADELLKGIEDRRLDLVALHRGYESQEASVRVAVLEQFPRITVGVNVSRDNSKVGTIGPAVTADLPIFDRNQGKIATEKATRQLLFDEYVNRVFEARSDIANLLATIETVNLEIAAAEESAKGLDRLVTTYRTAIQEGQADVVTYYTAWSNLVDKRVELVGFKQELIETRIALELAAGLYSLDAAKSAESKGGRGQEP